MSRPIPLTKTFLLFVSCIALSWALTGTPARAATDIYTIDPGWSLPGPNPGTYGSFVYSYRNWSRALDLDVFWNFADGVGGSACIATDYNGGLTGRELDIARSGGGTFTFKGLTLCEFTNKNGSGTNVAQAATVNFRGYNGAAIIYDSGPVDITECMFLSGFTTYTPAAVWSGITELRIVSTTDVTFDPFLDDFVYSLASLPAVTTGSASGISDIGATLNGSVNANGDSTAVAFEYGLTTGYGSSAAAAQSPVTGSSSTPVSAPISGLTCGITYHFRVTGTNDGGTSNGGDGTFSTSACNTSPTLAANSGLTLNQNAVQTTITTTLLQATDAEQSAAALTFTIGTAPTKGTLRNGAAALAAASTFTQADINSNLITFTPSGAQNGADGFTFTVSDGAGGSIGSTAFNITIIDNVPPTITSVSAPGNGTYVSGQNLDFTVNYSESVTVVPAGSPPSVPLTLDTGGTVTAAYFSGSGSTALVFRYTVVVGNQDLNGVSVGAAITSNGGTLRDAAGNDAALTLNNVGATTGVLIDAVAPTVSTVSVPANGTYVAGQNLNFTVNYSEAVTVNTSGGTPYIPLILNTGGTVTAGYISGNGTATLTFRYTVTVGNNDEDGIGVGASITANGGILQDASGNNAVLTLNNVGATTGVLIDAVAPTVSSVSVPANATYIAGQNLDFAVTFSETVISTGATPSLPITLDTGGTVNAGYVSGSGTPVLAFRYTVLTGNQDANGVSVGAAINANGGVLRDAAGNTAVLTLNNVESTLGVLVDAVAPTVSSVTVPADATYLAGQNLDFTVNYSEAVTVASAGSPPAIALTLDTGGAVNASYLSGSGTTALVFRYTVVTGNQDPNGISLGAAIAANGGTLRDAAENNAVLTLNNISSTALVRVDAVAPTLGSAAAFVDSTHVDVTFSEAVNGASTPANFTADNGLTISAATLQSGSTYRLTTSLQVIGSSYTITASSANVADLAGNLLSANTCSFTRTAGSNSAPSAPVISSPTTSAEVPATAPTLTVNASTDPDNDPIAYTYEVYSDSGLGTLVASASGQATSWTVTTTLSDNTRYWWRASATDGNAQSNWMTASNFFVNTVNDAPTAPGISSPNNTQVGDASPTLTVTNAGDADYDTLTYAFQVASDNGFLNIVTSASGVPQGSGSTAWTVPIALSEDTQYFWRARATDDQGTPGNWANSGFFVNATNATPGAPGLNWPADAAEITTRTPSLTVVNAVDADNDALLYTFEIDTAGTFTTSNKQTSSPIAEGAGTTSWTPSMLADNTIWFWRVKANDGAADGPWMTTASLFVNTVNDAPTAPTLQNPADNGQAAVLNPTLSLNAAADPDNDSLAYEYEIYTDSGLTNLAASTVGAGTSWIVGTALSDNTHCWWRARARDVHGLAGPWTAANAFFVNNNGYNDPPSISITAPGAASPVSAATYTIRWNATDPDSDPVITLSYDTTGSGYSGTQIPTGTIHMSDPAAYEWDLSSLVAGTYYIYAMIDDGTTVISAYAPGPLVKSSCTGDVNGDGIIDLADALKALRIAAGIDTPTAPELSRGDVAPLVGGVPQPDGKIDIADVLVILKKAVGLVIW